MTDIDALINRIDEELAAEVGRQKAAWAEIARVSRERGNETAPSSTSGTCPSRLPTHLLPRFRASVWRPGRLVLRVKRRIDERFVRQTAR